MTIIRKRHAALWVVATVVGPLFFYWFASGWYIGIWYARTGHHGPREADQKRREGDTDGCLHTPTLTPTRSRATSAKSGNV